MTADASKGPLREGESVILLDRKEREHLRRLEKNKPISIRGGTIAAEQILGRNEGSIVHSSLNESFWVFRPGLAQLIPNLPRQAQVIYPKDIGPILVWGDVFPGARIVEAGVGTGALTLALLRAIGPDGRLISYEIREDFAAMARANVARYFGAAPNWTLKVADVGLSVEESEIDRMILDLPEPWRVIEGAGKGLRPGGILLCYLPTILQVKGLVDALKDSRQFVAIETMETMMRFWHLRELSVRPQHRMVAHTGFLTVARHVERKEKRSP